MNPFNYDFQTKMYTVVTKSLAYTMPFVLTLRFKRFVQSFDWKSDESLIHKWYSNLDEREKILINCYPLNEQDNTQEKISDKSFNQ